MTKMEDKLRNPELNNKNYFVSNNDEIQSGQQYGYHICDKKSIKLVYDIIKRSGTQDATGWQMKTAEYMISMYDINIGATYGSGFILMYSSEECTVKFNLNDRDTGLFFEILKNCRDNSAGDYPEIQSQSEKSHTGIINITDSSLEKLIRYELNKPQGPLYEEELKGIKNISFQRNGSMLLSYKNDKLIALEKEMGDSIDLSELKYLPNLESVGFYGIKVINPRGLKYAQNLESLSMWDVGNKDIEVLKYLSNLTELHLGYNDIEDISSVAELMQLKILRLTSNKINNIESLQNLTKLTQLCLEDNRISDITTLKSLTNLMFLRLDNNQISDISILIHLGKLELLYIQQNRIKDYSPLDTLKISTFES